MGYFKLSLKNMTVAVLIAVCAVLAFWAFGQDENSADSEIRLADNGLAAPTARRTPHSPGKEPVMPRGFKPDTVWRDPFVVPSEITGVRPQVAPPTQPEPGGINQPELPVPAYTADLPLLAGIISSGSKQMAIIRHKGFSRVCREGEQVGNYRLAQITQDAVVLENGATRQTIRLP